MELAPYLNFAGTCAEAFAAYSKVFGGKPDMMTWGASPMAAQTPAEWHDKIINVSLKADGITLMGCDVPPSHYRPMQGFGVTLVIPTPAEVDRVFAALSEGGNVTMPLQKTFWSARFGMVTDRFGTPWLISCAQEA
ncbi:MAG TPA: VOC family protein [Hyphomicrobiales bacterium]|nr:VOC family protein [Hyphomicrobiales bacterium]